MEPNQQNKQVSKQNITRDIEIENKLTVTRGEMGGNNAGKREKGFSGKSIKDTWTKPRRGGIKGERWGWLGWEENGDNCTWMKKKHY